jgi:hypothetical protein
MLQSHPLPYTLTACEADFESLTEFCYSLLRFLQFSETSHGLVTQP